MGLFLRSTILVVDIWFRYAGALLIFAVILILLCSWKYWKYRRMYDVFPSYPLDMYLLRRFIVGGSESVPFTSFLLGKIVECCRRFESEGLCVLWGFRPLLFVYDKEYVKIFSNEEAAVDKMWFYEILKDTFGLGMITSSGKEWRKRRKLCQPVFNTQLLKRSIAVFNENAELLVKKMSTVANETHEDILGMLKKYTMDSFCETIFGLKLKNSTNYSKVENYIETVSELFEFSIYRFAHPWLYYTPLLPLFATGREHLKSYENIHQFSKFIVQEMGKTVSSHTKNVQKNGGTDFSEYRKSLPYILFETYTRDPSFTLQDLQDEVTTLLLAGHDTAAHTVQLCLFMLGHHQDVQDKLFDEVRSLPENSLTYEDISKLTYLQNVIKETLRLYPTVPLYARHLSTKVECGKYMVPKGTDVVIFPYLLHRNPRYFPDPEKFDPDRFSASSEIQPWSYVSFSEGIRNCIGNRFAMIQMKVLLTHILRNFEVTSLVNPEDVDFCWDIILTPARPLLFQLKPRKVSEDCS